MVKYSLILLKIIFDKVQKRTWIFDINIGIIHFLKFSYWTNSTVKIGRNKGENWGLDNSRGLEVGSPEEGTKTARSTVILSPNMPFEYYRETPGETNIERSGDARKRKDYDQDSSAFGNGHLPLMP